MGKLITIFVTRNIECIEIIHNSISDYQILKHISRTSEKTVRQNFLFVFGVGTGLKIYLRITEI